MLIRFAVENFLSFRDEVELSMVRGKTNRLPDHVISNGKRGSIRVLRTAVIYGANASGKSNLVRAIRFARQLIVKGEQREKRLAVQPFKFDRACAEKPSKFQFEIQLSSKSYIYGFTLDFSRIHEEWLYEITPSAENLVFERTTTSEGDTQIEFGDIAFADKGEQEAVQRFVPRATYPNQLFLTKTIDNKLYTFRELYDWFAKRLVIVLPNSRRTRLARQVMSNDDFKKAMEDLLRLFDTGISALTLQDFNLEEDEIIPPILKDEIRDELRETKPENREAVVISIGNLSGQRYIFTIDKEGTISAKKLMTVHKVKDDNDVIHFEVSTESDGTQRLLDLIPALLELFSSEKVYIIDELDRSLHPHLSYQIMELFLNNKQERRSQLIVTTHESSLLDQALLRRDEIWFVEKNVDGASTLYSLEEFAPRHDKDIRKGYLLGRYGAIPFVQHNNKLP